MGIKSFTTFGPGCEGAEMLECSKLNYSASKQNANDDDLGIVIVLEKEREREKVCA
jgi:hypothetical protein